MDTTSFKTSLLKIMFKYVIFHIEILPYLGTVTHVNVSAVMKHTHINTVAHTSNKHIAAVVCMPHTLCSGIDRGSWFHYGTNSTPLVLQES